jgi:mRNA interferase MazF
MGRRRGPGISGVTERYEPHEGDLIWTDFDPRIGREQAGRRPALVLSHRRFFIASGFVIVCPITKRVRPFPFSVLLPPETQIGGEILTSHIRSIDALSRPVRPAGTTVPAATLDEVRAKLAVLVGIARGA